MIFVADPASAFTLREQQILYYIAGGLSNKEIAGRLSLSEQTVKAHLFLIDFVIQLIAHGILPN